MTAKGWIDPQLKATLLLSIAHHASRDSDKAFQLLDSVLPKAESSGFVRTFVDEAAPMADLLQEAAARGMMPNYLHKLLSAFEEHIHKNSSPLTPSPHSAETSVSSVESLTSKPQPLNPLPPHPLTPSLIEPLTQRESEVLYLIAQGLSNREICDRLFLALSTVKGYNRTIFGKLQVQRRTEAVARARELGLLTD